MFPTKDQKQEKGNNMMIFGQSPTSTKIGYYLSSHATLGILPPAHLVTVREITAFTSLESRLIENVEEEFTLSASTF